MPVERDDEESDYVVQDCTTVCSPERSDGVEKESDSVETDVPNVLVLIFVTFFKVGDRRKLVYIS